MRKFIEKNWIGLLGASFLFTAFLYFLKIAFDSNWIPPIGRAAIGFALGITGMFAGYTFFKKGKEVLAEVLAGVGISVLFATFAYASFSEHISWSVNTMLFSMVALSGLVTAIGYKLNMRILVVLSMVGGFFTPLIIKADVQQDLILFLYVLVLNVSSLWLSAMKDWQELRVVSFVSTVAIFISYYFYFDPESWVKPFIYASCLFLVYMVGLITASWHEKNKFEGLNLYLGIINAIHYVFWSIFIFDRFAVSYAIPTLIVGGVFVAAGLFIHRISKGSLLPIMSYLLLGMLVIAIASSELGTLFATPGMHHVVNALVWLMLSGFLYFIGHLFRMSIVRMLGMVGWVFIISYWYFVAWDVEWVHWFGVKYVPFINPGAIVWMALAAFGFMISTRVLQEKEGFTDQSRDGVSLASAIASHVVLAGLFTVQIQNVWEAYNLSFIRVGLMLSIVWVLYALIIFLWGSFTRSTIYRLLGSIVLGVSAVKIFFFDLRGEANGYKVALLGIVGVLTLTIAYVDKRWSNKPPPPIPGAAGECAQELVE